MKVSEYVAERVTAGIIAGQEADLSGLGQDIADLERAATNARRAVLLHEPQRAAQVLRAWASMALAVVNRIEWAYAYRQGIADALVEVGRPLEAEVSDSKGNRGRVPKLHDCGSYGALDAARMAALAGCSTSAMRQRMKSGISPQAAIDMGARIR